MKDNLVLLSIYVPEWIHYVYPGSWESNFLCCNPQKRKNVQCNSESKGFCIVFTSSQRQIRVEKECEVIADLKFVLLLKRMKRTNTYSTGKRSSLHIQDAPRMGNVPAWETSITIDSNLQLLLPSIGKEISIPVWSPRHWFMYVQIVVYLWALVPPFREDFALCWERRFPVQHAYAHQIMLVYDHRASSITITFLITSLQIRTDLHSSQEMSEEVNHHRRIACEQCYKQPFFSNCIYS